MTEPLTDYYCAICLETENRANPQKAWFKETCQHEFHTECLMTWYRSQHLKCPLCNDRKRSYHTMRQREVDDFLLTVVQQPTTHCTPSVQQQLERWRLLDDTISNLQNRLTTLQRGVVYVAHTSAIKEVESSLRRHKNEQAAMAQIIIREHYTSPTVLVKEEHLPLLTMHAPHPEGERFGSAENNDMLAEILLELVNGSTSTVQRGNVTFATATYVTSTPPTDEPVGPE